MYPHFILKYGNGNACRSILESMKENGADVQLFCISANTDVIKSFYKMLFPFRLGFIACRIFSHSMLGRLVEWRYQLSLRGGDVAYIWPDSSLSLLHQIKKQHLIIVLEFINTHQKSAKRVLDMEYRMLSLPPTHLIGPESIDHEQAAIDLADYIFCPSHEVAESLINVGVSDEKLIRTSYGLSSKDILPLNDVLARNHREPETAIFVGEIGIRKGVHLLLQSWVKANVTGVLKLVGSFEEGARHLIEPFLDTENIIHIPFTDDLVSVYKDADIFLFPSLEEGSPLVTYLASGAGLPSIVSSMGSGGIVSHGREGLVIDPHDTDAWADAINRLFSDTCLRQKLAHAAYEKAPRYLWRNVGRQRLKLLRERIGGNN